MLGQLLRLQALVLWDANRMQLGSALSRQMVPAQMGAPLLCMTLLRELVHLLKSPAWQRQALKL